MTDLNVLAGRLDVIAAQAAPYTYAIELRSVAKELREMQNAPCPYCGEVR